MSQPLHFATVYVVTFESEGVIMDRFFAKTRAEAEAWIQGAGGKCKIEVRDVVTDGKRFARVGLQPFDALEDERHWRSRGGEKP